MDNRKKIIACELVRSSSSARSNAILFLILITITTLSLFIFSPTVKAYTYPTMSTEQAQATINYYKNSANNQYYNDNSNSNVQYIINNINAVNIANKFNEKMIQFSQNLSGDIGWENIAVLFFQNGNYVDFVFFIYDSSALNAGTFALSSFGNKTLFGWRQKYKNESKARTIQYAMKIEIDNSANIITTSNFQLYNSLQPGGYELKPMINNLCNKSGELFLNPLLAFSDNSLMYIDISANDTTGFYEYKNYLEFNSNGGIGSISYIEDNIISENGYFFWDNGVTTLDYNGYSKDLNSFFYIGNNLRYSNNYYYYNSSGERVNANSLININSLDYPRSGDVTGLLYLPKSSWVRYGDYYPYNIYQNLVVQYYSGDELLEEKTVIDDYLVINWSDSSISGDIIGTTTGTITNSSGEVIGNYSGEENLGNLGQKEKNEIENALEIDIPIEDPTGDFFAWFFEQLKNCFTINTAQYLNFTILDNEFTINSDDYILNIPVLRDVLGIGMGIFILYGIFKDIRGEIEKIKEGKFEQVGKEDISANML